MTVNPSTMRLGIAAILVGLVGAWGVRTIMDEEEPIAEKAEPRKVSVPQASGYLPENRIVRRGDIALTQMTQQEMAEKGWNLSHVMLGVEDIIGRQLRKSVSHNSPFLTTDLYLDGERAGYKVRDGYRAAQVTVNRTHGGHVEPGATVDLLFTTDEKPAKNGNPGIPEKTINVASAVTVLDVMRPKLTALQATVGYHSKEPTFTLEVEPVLATNISTLRGHGTFSLVERPEGDVALPTEGSEAPQSLLELLGIEPPEPERPTHTQWVTEYYRGRSGGARQFPVALPTPEELAMQEFQKHAQEMRDKGVPEKAIQAWLDIEKQAMEMAVEGKPADEVEAWRNQQLAALTGKPASSSPASSGRRPASGAGEVLPRSNQTRSSSNASDPFRDDSEVLP